MKFLPLRISIVFIVLCAAYLVAFPIFISSTSTIQSLHYKTIPNLMPRHSLFSTYNPSSIPLHTEEISNFLNFEQKIDSLAQFSNTSERQLNSATTTNKVTNEPEQDDDEADHGTLFAFIVLAVIVGLFVLVIFYIIISTQCQRLRARRDQEELLQNGNDANLRGEDAGSTSLPVDYVQLKDNIKDQKSLQLALQQQDQHDREQNKIKQNKLNQEQKQEQNKIKQELQQIVSPEPALQSSQAQQTQQSQSEYSPLL